MPTLYCPHCGYNLTGLTRKLCPECGEAFSPKQILLQRDREKITTYQAVLLLFIVPVFLAIVAGFLVVFGGMVFASLYEKYPIAGYGIGASLALGGLFLIPGYLGGSLGKQYAIGLHQDQPNPGGKDTPWPEWAYTLIFATIVCVLTMLYVAGFFTLALLVLT